MTTSRWIALFLGASTWACNSTEVKPAPATLVKSGGDGQSWYFNNPLPAPLTVTVRDVNGDPATFVEVVWKNPLGGGALSDDTTLTGADGVATITFTLGATTLNVVTATVGNLPSVAFTEHASAPPTSVGVAVTDNLYTPADTAVQTGGTVTWTWDAAASTHNITFTGGPTLPTNSGDRTPGTPFSTTFTTVGTYTYHCTLHPQTMNGTVVVVN